MLGSVFVPGDTIRLARQKYDWCAANARVAGGSKTIPPCCVSFNAFGTKAVAGRAEPPGWWNDDTSPKEWKLPAATICVWPYELMYGRKGKRNPSYDERLRLTQGVLRAVRGRREPSLLLRELQQSVLRGRRPQVRPRRHQQAEEAGRGDVLRERFGGDAEEIRRRLCVIPDDF